VGERAWEGEGGGAKRSVAVGAPGAVRGGRAGVPPRWKEKQGQDLDVANLFLAVACPLYRAGDDSTIDPR
jgi:hypothetical protein